MEGQILTQAHYEWIQCCIVKCIFAMLPFQRVCQELSKVGISQKDVEKGNENDNIPV